MISDDYRKEVIRGIIAFFQTEMDQEIGVIAAENILDHFLQSVGMKLYNKGVEDSVGYLKERLEDLTLDMEAMLKKQVN